MYMICILILFLLGVFQMFFEALSLINVANIHHLLLKFFHFLLIACISVEMVTHSSFTWAPLLSNVVSVPDQKGR